MAKDKSKKQFFENFASKASKAVGSPYAFITALSLVIVWAVCGPFFDFSETWQLVINTGTTIITFLMVFLIQKSQNKDSLAIQLKLNELVASSEKSSNRLVDIESMTEDEMMIVQKYYQKLSELSDKQEPLQTSHSIEEANEDHQEKYAHVPKKTTPKKQSPDKQTASKQATAKKTPAKPATRKTTPKSGGRQNTKTG
ncbi:low affinity iron permease family protein [Fluviicola sp.]|uniref:low affinity iron permease family protein n=1 Tax=Fluviicola sp. TaxID=1917219 RepID=UPI0031E2ADA4